MSRLFNSTTIVCIPAVFGEDNKGNEKWLPGTEEYTVSADVQPATNSPEVIQGQRVDESMNVYARSLPFTEARYLQVRWREDIWDIDGTVKFFNQGRRTEHIEFVMKKRGARG